MLPRRSLVALAATLVLAGAGRCPAAAPPPGPVRDLLGDPLPAGAIARLGTVRWRHLNGFHRPVLSPDGRWLVSSTEPPSPETSLHVWETATGRLRRTLSGEALGEWPFTLYAFLPDGKRLLSHDEKGTFALWEFPSFRLVKRWRGERVGSLVVSPDGRLAAGSRNGRVYLVALATGKGRWVDLARDRKGYIQSLAFTRDGRLVALHQWLPRPGDRLLVVKVFHIDLLTRRISTRIELRSSWADLAPDGQHLLTCGPRRDLWVHEVATGRKRRLGLDLAGNIASGLTFSRDGRRLVGVHAGLIWTWDVDRGELLNRVRLVDHLTLGLLEEGPLLAHGDVLLAWNRNALVRISSRTGRVLDTGASFLHPVRSLHWSADGRAVVAGARADHAAVAVARWDAVTGRLLDHSIQIPSHLPLGNREAWAYSPDGRVFAVGGGWLWLGDDTSERRAIRLFDLRTGNVLRELRGHTERATALAFSRDGKTLASVDEAMKVRLWDHRRGRVRRVLDASAVAGNVTGLVFDPDDRRLFLVETSGRLHLWDLRSGKHTRTLRPAVAPDSGHDNRGAPALGLFPPGGQTLFLLHQDHFSVWNLVAGRESEPFATVGLGPSESPHGGGVSGLSLSSDGRFLARLAGGLWLYEVASGQVMHRFPELYMAVAFHPSRLCLAAASETRLDTLIWDLRRLFLALPARPGAPTLAQLWADLADRDAGRAYRTVWRLAERPGLEAFLAGRLKPVPRLKPDWLAGQIAELGSEDFTRREKAERTLAPVVEAAQEALRQAHLRTRDLEQRLRLERLLARLKPRAAERLREHRAVFALEMRGTSAARRLLEQLARGAPGARLSQEARAALQRFAKRPG
jgi:WD40 repeat protein